MKSFKLTSKVPIHLLTSLLVYPILLTLYSILSFSLTDPNLTLTSWLPYQNFQNYMWQTFFHNRELLTYSYTTIITLLFINYFLIINKIKKATTDIRLYSYTTILKLVGIFTLVATPLLLSYNALSHDVFNYIFNAKMITVYGANPHVQVALDFAHDNWTRFMHNTHTPAPYGYGWTALSLLPFLAGFGKFLSTWLAFRMFSLLSIILLFLSLIFLAKKLNKPLHLAPLAVVFLNPLFLIEIISNSHNDLWMLVPAIVSLAMITTPEATQLNKKTVWGSLLLLSLSISTKLATVALTPIWLFLLAENNLLFQKITDIKANPLVKKGLLLGSSLLSKFLNTWWPLFASVLLFLPLLTTQSKQFLPWYLIWSLVWLPFVKWHKWKMLIFIFSISSMLRYIPWLWTGGFDGDVISQQKIITWILPGIYVLVLLGKRAYRREVLDKKRNLNEVATLEGKTVK